MICFTKFFRSVKCDLVTFDSLGGSPFGVVNQHLKVDPVVDRRLDLVWLLSVLRDFVPVVFRCAHSSPNASM